eukprot:TRINITY_DN6587_c0_g1_i1.p1 TRINITY_DN6587_c0_g1~~TRINITY_DN6587_c0_g1_i1.p1  ORF type:complete len:756 (-),score=133.77 TRINITY_DN6587_c0_g1_i1:165-2432(-)
MTKAVKIFINKLPLPISTRLHACWLKMKMAFVQEARIASAKVGIEFHATDMSDEQFRFEGSTGLIRNSDIGGAYVRMVGDEPRPEGSLVAPANSPACQGFLPAPELVYSQPRAVSSTTSESTVARAMLSSVLGGTTSSALNRLICHTRGHIDKEWIMKYGNIDGALVDWLRAYLPFDPRERASAASSAQFSSFSAAQSEFISLWNRLRGNFDVALMKLGIEPPDIDVSSPTAWVTAYSEILPQRPRAFKSARSLLSTALAETADVATRAVYIDSAKELLHSEDLGMEFTVDLQDDFLEGLSETPVIPAPTPINQSKRKWFIAVPEGLRPAPIEPKLDYNSLSDDFIQEIVKRADVEQPKTEPKASEKGFATKGTEDAFEQSLLYGGSDGGPFTFSFFGIEATFVPSLENAPASLVVASSPARTPAETIQLELQKNISAQRLVLQPEVASPSASASESAPLSVPSVQDSPTGCIVTPKASTDASRRRKRQDYEDDTVESAFERSLSSTGNLGPANEISKKRKLQSASENRKEEEDQSLNAPWELSDSDITWSVESHVHDSLESVPSSAEPQKDVDAKEEDLDVDAMIQCVKQMPTPPSKAQELADFASTLLGQQDVSLRMASVRSTFKVQGDSLQWARDRAEVLWNMFLKIQIHSSPSQILEILNNEIQKNAPATEGRPYLITKKQLGQLLASNAEEFIAHAWFVFAKIGDDDIMGAKKDGEKYGIDFYHVDAQGSSYKLAVAFGLLLRERKKSKD